MLELASVIVKEVDAEPKRSPTSGRWMMLCGDSEDEALTRLELFALGAESRRGDNRSPSTRKMKRTATRTTRFGTTNQWSASLRRLLALLWQAAAQEATQSRAMPKR